jgi:cytochrome c oxidase assembly protein Cox11
MHPITYIGIGLIILAAVIGFRQYSFVQSAKSAEGKVITLEEVTEKRSQKGGNKKLAGYTDNVPTIEFTTNTGQKFSFKAEGFTNPNVKIGDSVQVLYNPTNPQDAKINATKWLYSLPLILFGLGTALTFFALRRQ